MPTIPGTPGNDTLIGGDGSDQILGFGGDDRLEGGDNIDELVGGEGNDTMLGGNGNDRLVSANGGGIDVVDGGAGTDVWIQDYGFAKHGVRFVPDPTPGAPVTDPFGTTIVNVERWDITGSDYNDTLSGGALNDSLNGNSGDDVMYGLGGRDSLWDMYGNNTMYGGDGDDRLEVSTGDNKLYGEAGNDLLLSGLGDSILDGGDGNDTIRGNGTLYGGQGDDSMQGRGTLYGGDGNDSLTDTGVMVGQVTLLFDGGAGNDRLVGFARTFLGGDGDDTLNSLDSVSAIDGGAGQDRWEGNFNTQTSGLRLVMDTAPGATTTVSNGTTLVNVEAITVEGTDFADTITGGNGDDIINSRRGADIIDGGGGNDRWRANFDDLQGPARFALDTHPGAVTVAPNGTTLRNIESVEIRGTTFGDRFVGGDGGDRFEGAGGDDTLIGGAGNDILNGGAGHDVIEGGAGDDWIFSDREDVGDVFRFTGNFGNDRIDGFNKTADRLDLRAFTSYTLTQDGNDTIVTVEGGTIRLRFTTPDGLDSQIDIACLLRGTRIRTPAGEVAVETLRIGDPITTIDGIARRLKWIGCRRYSADIVRHSRQVAPIRIAAGALGAAGPKTDLFVSPAHAMYLWGALVPAERLANGGTIRQVMDVGAVEYFHLEFDTPDVLWANGAPTESYVNHGNRRMFANWQTYVDRYGAEDEAARGVDGHYVRRFPLVDGGPALREIRDRLARRVARTRAA